MAGDLMEREIREQPAVLRAHAARYAQELDSMLVHRQFDMVLLAARGTSDNAALYARYLFEIRLGIPVSLAAPSVLTRYGTRLRYPRCLAIGISQSGAAPDVAEVLTALRQDGHTTLAITNTAGSRCTQAAEHSLLLDAGTEQSVAATKTYTASLLALYALARVLGAALPPAAGHNLPDDNWIETTREAASRASGAIVRCAPIFALGRGYDFSTCCETALKLMECALIPCKAYSSADFEHGPKALAGPGSAAISFGGPMPHLSAQGCEVVEAPTSPTRQTVPEELGPVWDAAFGQWVALTAARARGLNPDIPRHLRKVTETL